MKTGILRMMASLPGHHARRWRRMLRKNRRCMERYYATEDPDKERRELRNAIRYKRMADWHHDRM